MFARLVALFIGLPLLEIVILVKLGEEIGFWPTIGLVVITGFVGASLARWQGVNTYAKIQRELEAGRVPASELLDGLLILIGGIVLLTPGLLTDLFGFLLLIPWARKKFRLWLRIRFTKMAREGDTRIFMGQLDSDRYPME